MPSERMLNGQSYDLAYQNQKLLIRFGDMLFRQSQKPKKSNKRRLFYEKNVIGFLGYCFDLYFNR